MQQNRSISVFIAEDEPITLVGLSIMVEEIGHRVIGEANDGPGAIDGIISTDPDLIIMDIDLPVIDGLSVLEEVYKIKPIPSIIITGYREHSFIDKANALGAFGYLQKPVDSSELNAMIKIAISRFEELGELKKNLDDVKTSLAERKIIEKAKGIVMEQLGYKEPQAMKYLQLKSRQQNKKIFLIAKEIIDKQK